MITATEKETVGLVTYQKIPAKCVAAVKKPQSDVADYWKRNTEHNRKHENATVEMHS